ncbi:hypothetical protein ACQEVZ_54865 [Dactylosporangium sp. CA-152071]|uniref:hypothetical protein n=1 Tax=Dactylosporangium sp. CA-152071 TaxID=3239933 RepID=UPI003D8DA935
MSKSVVGLTWLDGFGWLTADQLDELRAAAERIQIVGARYPAAQDAMTNRGAPLPTA